MPYTSRETYEFISCQTNDPIVEWKTCKVSGQPFPIYQSDMDFYEKISPTFNGKKFGIPTPTLCPEERERRRLAFRNERELYRRKCDFSGKSIISIYSPDKPFKVYEQDIWWSDKRNPFDYGRLFTFQQSFFEQFASLLADVPKIALYEKSNENSIYTNDTTHNKNCYLIFSSDYNENCCYGVFNNSKSSIDCLECRSIEKCYECVNCLHCHKLFYALDCEQCTHSSFLINCVNCDHCFLSHNLNGKRYYFLNKPYSPQEYQEKIKNLTLKEAKKNFETVIQKTIHRHLKINASENCIGNDIEHSQNCKYCFDTLQARNCSYIFFGSQTLSDCQDTICASIDASKCYQVQNCLEHCHQIMSCNFSNNIQFSYYLNNCINCSQCFGCVGLRNKEYCIFNKQYEKTEYERLIFQIIEKMQEDGEWGEFFPPSLSPFGYNETVAQEYFPLTKETSGLNGYKRNDYSSDPKIPENATLLYPAQLPDEERNALVNDDSVLKKVIICKESQRPFIIQKLELDFYRKMGLPLPKLHPNVRHEARMKQRPGRTLYLRTCDKCQKEMISVYPADDERKVYCEDCYTKEVYG